MPVLWANPSGIIHPYFGPGMIHVSNVDSIEVDKFSSFAARWWEPNGPSAPLHVLNPIRLSFIQQQIELNSALVLDIGCGAGILSEALAKCGAHVTGIDASPEMIEAARTHAEQGNLIINYSAITIECFIQNQDQLFDAVVCMELIEHVPDPQKLIADCVRALKPGGKLFISTINRTPKAYALAILGAEYVLNLLPKQTHDYNKFIRPAELASMLGNANLQLKALAGVKYQPFSKNARIHTDVSVNYMAYAEKAS